MANPTEARVANPTEARMANLMEARMAYPMDARKEALVGALVEDVELHKGCTTL
jgi:hypothetical protein